MNFYFKFSANFLSFNAFFCINHYFFDIVLRYTIIQKIVEIATQSKISIFITISDLLPSFFPTTFLSQGSLPKFNIYIIGASAF